MILKRKIIVSKMSIKLNDILPTLALLELRISCVLSVVFYWAFSSSCFCLQDNLHVVRF